MIRFEAHHHVELQYFVLSHLDLGADAASIYRPRNTSPPWLPEAREGYDGLAAQVRALRVTDLDALCAASPASWIEALLAAEDTPAWPPPTPDVLDIEAPLAEIHETLWALSDAPSPLLRVFDTPSLGRHGRATQHEGAQLDAVSLADPAHALCQIAHEACHAVTDPAVRARFQMRRDTRPGHPGYALHRALEAVAIEVVRDVIAEVAPAWSPAYARWAGPHTLAPRG